MARRVFKPRYEEAIRQTRLKLGMKPDAVVDTNGVFLSPDIHSIKASDGSRWSNWGAQIDREQDLRRQAREKIRSAMVLESE